ncbi:MAG TPA: hypothetical protein VFJ05_03030 [Nitrososphaeraceae archaeon]|nr:hypothetical protein [Nitrososphaeraceae archaeon]
MTDPSMKGFGRVTITRNKCTTLIPIEFGIRLRSPTLNDVIILPKMVLR